MVSVSFLYSQQVLSQFNTDHLNQDKQIIKMFKLLVLSALIAVAAAAPSLGYSALGYDLAPDYAVSSVVTGAVPTAYSSQSRVDYQSKPVVSPIIAPVVRAIPQPAYAVSSPAVAYSAPLLHSAPLIRSAPWASAYAAGW